MFVSLPWALASDPAAALLVPWCVALAGALLSAATVIVGLAFGVTQIIHGLLGTSYTTGLVGTVREFCHIVGKSSTFVGRVSVFALLLSPVGIAVASLSGATRASGDLSQPKMVASVGLCLAVVLLSAALVLWSSEAVWNLLLEVPVLSRLALSVLVVALPMHWMPGLVRQVLSSALRAWLPPEIEGYSAEYVVTEVVRSTPLPGGFALATVTAVAALAYIHIRVAGAGASRELSVRRRLLKSVDGEDLAA